MYRKYCALLESNSSSSKGPKSPGKQQPNKKIKKRKLPKPASKEAKYFAKQFANKIRKYGEKRTTLRSWEKDKTMAWLKKARKNMNEEKIRKEEEEKEKDVEIIPEDEIIEVIHVKNVDLHIPQNTKDHHTDKYFVTDKKRNKNKLELVIRRGQEFKMTIAFDRPYNRDNDDIKFVFEIGLKGSLTKETLAMIEIDDKKPENTDDWNARIVSQNGNKVELMILTPSDCIIGEWTFDVITQFIDNKDVVNQFCYEYPENINIILNPWCQDDTCYLEKEEERDEYVLNDDGFVFQGSSKQIYTKPWHFGQFDRDILDISMRLLRAGFGGNITNKMADPVQISRTVAMVVNACDEDEGVLIGNWSGNYEDGRCPSSWSGSAKILQKFLKDKKSVKYGQCWVFSAVTVTVCRALGLPCRSVTNFGSAHDTDGSTTIDWLYEKNEYGKLEKQSGGDSIWNFHVWNECWFDRPDLPPGYGGWQVIDATPQETSDGVYTCGPASVVAIKKGEISMKYDTGFVFAEVNADIKKYEVLGGFRYDPLGEITDRVGKKISTKKIDKLESGEGSIFRNLFNEDSRREDITCHYKYPEGSAEEHKAVENAGKYAKFSYGQYTAPPKDLEVTLTDIDRVMIGEEVTVEIIVKNISEEKEKRTIPSLIVEIYCCKYTGDPVGEAIKVDGHTGIELNYNESKKFTTKLCFEDYWNQMQEYGSMLVVVSGKCNETQRPYLETDNFRILRPNLEIKAPESCKLGEIIDMEVTFKNPVPLELRDCKLFIDAGQFQVVGENGEPVGDDEDGQEEFPLGTIKEKEEVTKVIKLKGVSPNSWSFISANFDSVDLHDIAGTHRCLTKWE